MNMIKRMNRLDCLMIKDTITGGYVKEVEYKADKTGKRMLPNVELTTNLEEAMVMSFDADESTKSCFLSKFVDCLRNHNVKPEIKSVTFTVSGVGKTYSAYKLLHNYQKEHLTIEEGEYVLGVMGWYGLTLLGAVDKLYKPLQQPVVTQLQPKPKTVPLNSVKGDFDQTYERLLALYNSMPNEEWSMLYGNLTPDEIVCREAQRV